jgi:hypothetical protein
VRLIATDLAGPEAGQSEAAGRGPHVEPA